MFGRKEVYKQYEVTLNAYNDIAYKERPQIKSSVDIVVTAKNRREAKRLAIDEAKDMDISFIFGIVKVGSIKKV